MSCSPFDLRDYFLKELPPPERQQVETHVKTCQACREELERLQITEAALFSLRDEEIPQRIAFVSDPVFEPSPVRRWWTAFWGSSARLGFASASMLSAALVFFAVTRPAPVGQIAYLPQPAPAAPTRTISDADIQARVEAAVIKAVAQVETRDAQRIKELTAEMENTRRALVLATAEYDILQKRSNYIRSAYYASPSADQGDLK